MRVSADALSIRTGLWFAPVERRIPLAGLEAIIETDEEVSQRHASRRDTVWEFRFRSGAPLRLVLPISSTKTALSWPSVSASTACKSGSRSLVILR